MPRVVALLCMLSAVQAQSPTPDAASQAALIERVRAAALSYTDRLQDFVCNQLTSRSTANSPDARHWKPLETQELELTYISHKENYRLLKVNGKNDNVEKRVKQGYFKPSGEFGTSLQKIFDPKANTEFTWDHTEISAGKRSCVFRYNVPTSTSTMWMQVNLQYIRLGHHGFVDADCDTGSVTRIRTVTDVPTIREQGHDIQIGSDLDVRYGPVTIGSKEFLLPQQAELIARFHTTFTKAEIQFQQYRKYDSNSTVTFDTPPKY